MVESAKAPWEPRSFTELIVEGRKQMGSLVKRVRLDSSAIAAVTYDEKKQTLTVEFRDGETYRYAHVSEFVYRELLQAESAGAFWNSVKENYEFVKVD